MLDPFANEALTDFTNPENRKLMEEALANVENQFGREYPMLIGGRDASSSEKINSYNPAKMEDVVGIAQRGTREDAEAALGVAWKAFDTWRWTRPEERAACLVKLAARMRERKFELSSWMVYEVGKNWIEADADMAEAIDFCEFYAREAIRYGAVHPMHPWPGETNELAYIPLGAGAAIPPWNFPAAILVGLAIGPVAAGNTIVVKPASDSPIIAAKVMELVKESGFPDGVINFVTGSGSDVGETLVQSPRTRFINFTGSREVGLHIAEEAARHREGQRWIKRKGGNMRLGSWPCRLKSGSVAPRCYRRS